MNNFVFIMLRLFVFVILFQQILGVDENNWWKHTEIYEIFIRSFKDSNGDGVGDLKGITDKLHHFTDLQIGSIWISPFYESTNKDVGYDIVNYTSVDPVYGSLDDFDELSREAKKRGIQIFIDVVINHSSDEHIWFKKSIDKIQPYDEYYVWKNAKGFDEKGRPIPPNNWVSIFEGQKAWQWNDKRKQFYLHQFSVNQPDFDLRNENVKQEMKDVLKFWFDRGVTGLRMDAAGFYLEDPEFRDEPLRRPNIKKDEFRWADFSHMYTYLWSENLELLRELRQFIDDVNKRKRGHERVMIAEIYALPATLAKFYGNETDPVVHYPMNSVFATIGEYLNASSLHKSITDVLKPIPKHGIPTWMAENHDRNRIGSKFTIEYINIMNVLVMMLPGVACLYNGQEIGMVDGLIRPDQIKDLFVDPFTLETRDYSRTPMQWDDSINAGFTSKNQPWLPVNPNYWHLNVENEINQNNSHYNILKELSHLRKTDTCKFGAFNSYVLSTWIYAFTRTWHKNRYIIVFNLGSETELINLSTNIPKLPVFLKVLVASGNSGYQKGDIIKSRPKFPRSFAMRPLSTVILSATSIKKRVPEDSQHAE